MSFPADETLEPEKNPAIHGTVYLSVTGDTSERARADLATLTLAIQGAFPSAERNLMVSLSNSTVPAPNGLSRRISFGVRAAVVLIILGARILMVVGAHVEGERRAGLFAAIATPFTMLIYPSGGGRHATDTHSPTFIADWKFVLLLLALTPISAILSMWLTRKGRTGLHE